MPFICKDCHNKTRFLEDCYGSYTETNVINEEGDFEDSYGDIDYNEKEKENLRCKNCGSDDIHNVEDYEWENWSGPTTIGIDWKARYSRKKK